MIIQVGSFKLTGRRVFRMAPLQHHFELLGWGEVTIVIRFWIIAGLFVAPRPGHLLRRVGGRLVSEAAGRLDALTDCDADWAGLDVVVAGLGGQRVRRGRRAAAARGPARRGRRRATGRPSRSGPRSCGSWAPTSGSVTTRRRRCPDGPTWSSPRRAGGRSSPCWRPRPRPGSRSGARSSWPGGCGRRTAAPPWLTAHRHERQDHDRADARGDAAGRRAARRRRSGNVGTADRCDAVLRRAAVRRARRRAVQLPAALATGPARSAPAGQRGAQRRARPRRLARLAARRTPRTRAGSTSAPRWPASTTSPTRAPSSWCATPTSPRAAARSASPSARRRSGMVGVVDDVLVDRAFVEERRTSAAELGTLDDVRATRRCSPRTTSRTRWPRRRWPARTACRRPRSATACAASGPTRTGSRTSPTVDGVTYVDDSKATNPHAAAASLAAFELVVWVAGGLLKGADVDDLVRAHAAAAARRRADRPRPGRRSREALARHAPEVPVVEVASTDTGAHGRRRARAPRRWRGPATPCCSPRPRASMDLFRDYGERGDAFAAAVRRLARARQGDVARDAARSHRRDGVRRARQSPACVGTCPPLERLDSPLTTYYVLLGATLLLLVLGLVMVLSASSVDVAVRAAARRSPSSEPAALRRDRAAADAGRLAAPGALVAARSAGRVLLGRARRAAAGVRRRSASASTATGTGSSSAASGCSRPRRQARARPVGRRPCWPASGCCWTAGRTCWCRCWCPSACWSSGWCWPGTTSAPRWCC